MGANSFKKFIKSNGIIDCIAMRDEIANWKINHDGKPPVILIDLKDCVRMLVLRDRIGVILGGHYDRYNKMMRQFLENITRTGARLVFFMPGRQQSDDLPFFIPKTEQIYMDSLEILDKMDEKSDLKTFSQKFNRMHAKMCTYISFEYNLKILVSNFGDFYVTHEQHSQEIARYAIQNADFILALITEDMDFMTFPGAYELWRAKSINFKEMTCNRYNKNRLYDKFGFEQATVQMHLFSALCRSIFLPLYVIEEFLNGLASEDDNPQRSGIIWNVSAYVKRQPFTMVHNKLTYDLEQISRDVFGDGFSREQLNSISNGLAYYDLNFEQTSDRNLSSFLKHCRNMYSFAYKLATDSIFIVKDISYMDFRNYKSKSYAEMIIPILMKLCGILYKDDVLRPMRRKICMKHAHDEPSKVTEELVMYPSMKLPKLFDFMFKTRMRQFDGIRWLLLEWVLDLDDGILSKIQDKKNLQRFASVITTLQYLVQQEELTPKEANIILFTQHHIYTAGWSVKTHYPKHPNAHYVRIANLYVKIYVLISHCFQMCGLPHMADLLRFDGAIFHRNMTKFEIETKQLVNVLESAIKPIWIFS